jgi:hypothetical protein
MNTRKKGLGPDSMEAACRFARHNAYEWTKRCTSRWHDGILSGNFGDALYGCKDVKKFVEDSSKSEMLRYLEEWKRWNESSTGVGLVTIPAKLTHAAKEMEAEGAQQSAIEGAPTNVETIQGLSVSKDKEFQLWRAQGTLPDYICPGGRKRSEINGLINQLSQFGKVKEPKYPFNCLLLAEPGWGKSHLAKCISKHFGFEYLSFSVAQMASNRELIESFKMVASVQNQQKGKEKKKLLVFVDEVDAEIEGHNALGLMLGPIWDGTFASDGNTYKINPCVWFFASSTLLKDLKTQPKATDFLSRINGPIIDMGLFEDSHNGTSAKNMDETSLRERAIVRGAEPGGQQKRTELVYLGVNFLNNIFGPLSYISEGVLDVLHNSIPFDGVRSIEIFISRFKGITRGTVTVENLPDPAACPELERHIVWLRPTPWKDTPDGELISVETKSA